MILASGDLWAGAEVMVYQLSRGLAQIEGIEFCVVLLNRGRLAEELERLGLNVHVIDESETPFLSLILGVKKLVADFSPDVIHSHRYKENLLAWLVTIGTPKVKLVTTQHGMPEMAGTAQSTASRFRSGLFFRLLSCCFHRTVAVSREMQQALVGSYGFAAKDVTVIHNGIGLPDYTPHSPRKRVVVGSAGRLFPVKDFSLFVDIARHVISRNENVDFMLAGDGPERTLLEGKVRESGIQKRFTFSGHVEDMDAFYMRLDIYLNTSVHEGIPMSVLEAMSHGLPVVVPKVGGFPEIIEDGVSGFLVPGRDSDGFADKIIALLQVDTRRSAAEAARLRVVEHFSREAMARAYCQLYEELVVG